MIQTSDIVTLIFFGIALLMFVWLFRDVRAEMRSRELTWLEERKMLISVLQQNATQLPAITRALEQVNDNLDELNKHMLGKTGART